MCTCRLKTYNCACSLREGLSLISPVFAYIGLGGVKVHYVTKLSQKSLLSPEETALSGVRDHSVSSPGPPLITQQLARA